MFQLRFHLNDNTKPEADCCRPVDVLASHDEVEHLVREGWLRLDNLVSETQLDAYREALDRVVAAESEDPRTEHVPNNGHYLRNLLDKDTAFHPMLYMKKPLSIGRATIGPQVWFDVEARVVPAGLPGMRVNWHIHHRVIPNPMPPFFSYPHAIHGLLYLDDVSKDTGCICILPRSHLDPNLSIPAGNCDSRLGEIEVPTKAGTILLMHANTWHRTVPTTVHSDRRRLLLFGYTPAWIKPDVARGVKPKIRLTDRLRAQGDSEIRELLGEYYW